MSVGTKQLRAADVLEWVRENYAEGTPGPTSLQAARTFGCGVKTAWRCLDSLRRSRHWRWGDPASDNNGAKAASQMAAGARCRRESWEQQMRAAVARYEARRGQREAVVELAAALADYREATGRAVAFVGGFRYRLDAADRTDVVRERLVIGPGTITSRGRADGDE
jgi:hypothetical protein